MPEGSAGLIVDTCRPVHVVNGNRPDIIAALVGVHMGRV